MRVIVLLLELLGALCSLRADHGEATNLATREPVRAKELRAALAAWRQHVGARMPVPNPNHDPARASQLGKGKNADQ